MKDASETHWRNQAKPQTAAQIARDAIPLLEHAIWERFGVKVQMGAELEFSVIPADGLAQGDDPLEFGVRSGDAIKKRQMQDFKPLKHKPDFRYHGFMGQSPAICYAYRETSEETEAGTFKYEYVFSHETPAGIQFLADEIVDTKCVMQGKEPVYRDIERVSANLPNPFPGGYWKQVLFDPSLPYYKKSIAKLLTSPFLADASLRKYSGERLSDKLDLDANAVSITHGLHFTLSVNRPGEDMDELGRGGNGFDAKKNLRAAIAEVMEENIFVLDSPKSYRRRDELYHALNDNGIMERNEGDGIYIENKLCDAATDPHLGAMLHLISVYHMFQACEYDKDTITFQKDIDESVFGRKLKSLRSEQFEAFKAGSIAKNILNEISEANWGTPMSLPF